MTTPSPAAGRAFAPIGLTPFGALSLPSLRQLRPVLLPVATAGAFLLLWQAACALFHISQVILPEPSEIARELWRILPTLLREAVPTTVDTLISFAVATVLGVALAIAVTYSALLRDALYPNLVVFQLIPKIALAPLFVVWLGINSTSHVAFSAFISFFPVVISAALGFAGADTLTLRLCRSLTASDWQSFLLVRFPFALPAIFSGMKIAMTMAIIGVIIGEFISSKAGLGYYILYASSRMDTAAIFAALFVLSMIGVALFGAVALAERHVRQHYGRH
jgi:NitT/TauT family transport system permease protein